MKQPTKPTKQLRIAEVLMTYCDPKPEISGVLAWDIAGRILDAIEQVRAEEVSA